MRVRTMVKDRIQVMLDRYPELRRSRPTNELFGAKGLAWLREAAVKPTDRQMLDEDLKLLQELHQHIGESDKLVEELAEEDWRVEMLKTIPGIGKFFAVLIAYEVDEISRFAHEKKFFSYLGLIPSTYSSGGRTFHGRLTKQGNKYLRWALVEAGWPAIRTDCEVRNYYERIRAQKGPNPAKVATARRLARIVYRFLSQQRPYRVSGCKLPS